MTRYATTRFAHALRSHCGRWCVGMAAAIALAGCAAPQGVNGNAAARPLLQPWQTLTGARLHVQPVPTFGAMPKTGGNYVNFLVPAMVAARNNLVYVADSGHRQIFRYDATQMAMSRFADYPATVVAGMTLAPDMSLYVADIASHRVLHFSHDGRLLRTFGSEALARPVSVVWEESVGQLLVADSLYNHVVVFNSLGRALGTLKSDETRTLEAMARGPEGLYLVDRQSKQVVVLGMDGIDRYAFGSGMLKDPHAIAVDRYGRVFVSDEFDNAIKVFQHGELIATVGGAVDSRVKFNRVTGMWLDKNTLYVADSLQNRIQIFHVSSPSIPEGEKRRDRPH